MTERRLIKLTQCRWPDANPHANHGNPILKLAEKISNF